MTSGIGILLRHFLSQSTCAKCYYKVREVSLQSVMMISKKSFAAKLYRISRPPRLGNAVNIHMLLSQRFITFTKLKKPYNTTQ